MKSSSLTWILLSLGLLAGYAAEDPSLSPMPSTPLELATDSNANLTEKSVPAQPEPEVLDNRDPLIGTWNIIHNQGGKPYTAYQLNIVPSSEKGKFHGLVTYTHYSNWNLGDVKAVFSYQRQYLKADWIINPRSGKSDNLTFSTDNAGNYLASMNSTSGILMSRITSQGDSTFIPVKIMSSGGSSQNKSYLPKPMFSLPNRPVHFAVGLQLAQINYSGKSSENLRENILTQIVGSVEFQKFIATLKLGGTNVQTKRNMTIDGTNMASNETIDFTIVHFLAGMVFNPNDIITLIPQLGMGVLDASSDSYYSYVSVPPITSWLAGYSARIRPLPSRNNMFFADLSSLYSSTDFRDFNSDHDFSSGYFTYQFGLGVRF